MADQKSVVYARPVQVVLGNEKFRNLMLAFFQNACQYSKTTPFVPVLLNVVRLGVPSRYSFAYEVARRFLLATAGANKKLQIILNP